MIMLTSSILYVGIMGFLITITAEIGVYSRGWNIFYRFEITAIRELWIFMFIVGINAFWSIVSVSCGVNLIIMSSICLSIIVFVLGHR